MPQLDVAVPVAGDAAIGPQHGWLQHPGLQLGVQVDAGRHACEGRLHVPRLPVKHTEKGGGEEEEEDRAIEAHGVLGGEIDSRPHGNPEGSGGGGGVGERASAELWGRGGTGHGVGTTSTTPQPTRATVGSIAPVVVVVAAGALGHANVHHPELPLVLGDTGLRGGRRGLELLREDLPSQPQPRLLVGRVVEAEDQWGGGRGIGKGAFMKGGSGGRRTRVVCVRVSGGGGAVRAAGAAAGDSQSPMTLACDSRHTFRRATSTSERMYTAWSLKVPTDGAPGRRTSHGAA